MSALDRRADRLAQVRAQVDSHGQRLELYPRLHGSRPSARRAELEHAYASACERLAGATEAQPKRGTSAPWRRERRGGRMAGVNDAFAIDEEDRRALVRPPLGALA